MLPIDAPFWLVLLTDVSLKGLLLLAGAGAVALLLYRASAALRHLAWALAMGGVLLLPALSLALPDWRLAVLPPAERTPQPVRTPGPGPRHAPPPELARVQFRPGIDPVEKRFTVAPSALDEREPAAAASLEAFSWPHVLLLVWLLGVCAVLAPILAGTLALWRAGRYAPVKDKGIWQEQLHFLARQIGLRRHVRLRGGPPGSIPLSWGFLRPTVLLPADAGGWTDERRRLVLLHELAHVRRWDSLTQLAAQLACALHWFDPLVWVAARRLRLERERACDDLVLGTGPDASSYAQHLLDIARQSRSLLVSPAAAVAMARRSQLEGRLLAILDAARNRRAVTRFALAAGLAAAVMAAGLLAMVQPVARAEQESPVSVARAVADDAALVYLPSVEGATDAVAYNVETSSLVPFDRQQRRPQATGHLAYDGRLIPYGASLWKWRDGRFDPRTRPDEAGKRVNAYAVAPGERWRLTLGDERAFDLTVVTADREGISLRLDVQPAVKRPAPGLLQFRLEAAEPDPARADRLMEMRPEYQQSPQHWVSREVLLDESHVDWAAVEEDNRGNATILLSFSEAGRARFAEITGEHIGKRLFILYEGNILSAPVIRERITGGRAQITGSFSREEAERIAADIAPAPDLEVRLTAVRTVWEAGQAPSFTVRLANRWDREAWVCASPTHDCRIELDGEAYRWDLETYPVQVMEGPMRPGEETEDIPVTLDHHWVHVRTGQSPPPMAPGPHTVRVGWRFGGERVLAWSDPLAIEVRPPALQGAAHPPGEQLYVAPFRAGEDIPVPLAASASEHGETIRCAWVRFDTVGEAVRAELRVVHWSTADARWRIGLSLLDGQNTVLGDAEAVVETRLRIGGVPVMDEGNLLLDLAQTGSIEAVDRFAVLLERAADDAAVTADLAPVGRPAPQTGPCELAAEVEWPDGRQTENAQITLWRSAAWEAPPAFRSALSSPPRWCESSKGRPCWEPVQHVQGMRATISDLPPGRYRLSAVAMHQAAGPDDPTPYGYSDTIELEERAPRVEAKVRMQENTGSLHVHLRAAQSLTPAPYVSILLLDSEGFPIGLGSSGFHVLTDESGNAWFRHLPEGHYWLQVNLKGWWSGQYLMPQEERAVQVLAGQEQEVVVEL